jgi:hypothetical protein
MNSEKIEEHMRHLIDWNSQVKIRKSPILDATCSKTRLDARGFSFSQILAYFSNESMWYDVNETCLPSGSAIKKSETMSDANDSLCFGQI